MNMKISNIKVTITEKDLYSIVSEVLDKYIKIPGIAINKILIDEYISVSGVYKNKITIPFELGISIKGVKNNVLYLTIEKINVKKIRIINSITNMVIKVMTKQFEEFGIDMCKKIISIDFYKLCPIIPWVDFVIKDLKLISYGLEAEVSDFNFINEENALEKNEHSEISNPVKKIEIPKTAENSRASNARYTYRNFRGEFKYRFPKKYECMYDYVVLIPDIIALLLRLFRDKKVTKETKFNISIALAYLFFPLDILPDSIPFIGQIDDIAVTFFMLQKILCDIPEEIILENWDGEENIIVIVKEAIGFLNDKFKVNEIKKIVDIVRISLKKSYNFFVE